METRGWLLDAYIEDNNAVHWFKTENGDSVRLVDRYRPIFIAKPVEGFDPVTYSVAWTMIYRGLAIQE